MSQQRIKYSAMTRVFTARDTPSKSPVIESEASGSLGKHSIGGLSAKYLILFSPSPGDEG